MEQLKKELVEVISKYVEIDPHGIDITLTNTNRQSQLTAHVPVTGTARQK
jgi:cell division topological specificity factor MinE